MRDIANIIASATNPILAAILLIAIFVRRRPRPWGFLLACAAGVGIAVELAEVGKDVLLYPDPHGFPSGHETFAAAVLTCLVWLDRRWLLPAIPVAVVMGVALVLAQYHAPIDVVGAAFLGPIPPSLILLTLRRPERPPASGSAGSQ